MEWVNATLQGILLGGLYALFAAGLSLMFGVMRFVNLAHGDFIIVAAYAALLVVGVTTLHPLLALLIVAPVLGLLGYGAQRLVFNRTLGADILPPILVTFGISVILQNVLLEVFSANTQKLQAGALETTSIDLPGGLAIGVLPLLTFVAAVLVILALEAVFYRTPLGRVLRATSDDKTTVKLMGADNNHIFAIATAIASVVVAIAGVLLAMRTNFDPGAGPIRLLYAFEVVIIAGLGNLRATLAGGIILGVAQTVGAQIDPGWRELAGHVVFLAILIVRPQGLAPRIRE